MANLFGNGRSAGEMNSVRKAHSRVRNTFMYYDCDDADAAIGDILPISYHKPGDRVRDIRVYVIDNDATTGTADIGLYSVDRSNGGEVFTVIDADLFETTPFVLNADIAFPGTDIITAGPLTDVARSQSLWEVAGLSAAPTTDVDYVIAFTFREATNGTDGAEIFAEVEYVAGDLLDHCSSLMILLPGRGGKLLLRPLFLEVTYG